MNVAPAPPRVRPRTHAAPKRTRRPRSTPSDDGQAPVVQLVVDEEARHERQRVGFDEQPLEHVGTVALDREAPRWWSMARLSGRWSS